jgi:hypothetical protein
VPTSTAEQRHSLQSMALRAETQEQGQAGIEPASPWQALRGNSLREFT